LHCIGNSLKWFPDRRGLAAGLTAAGFGAGSALTVLPIVAIIKSSGYETAFLYFGFAQGLIVFLISFGLTAPHGNEFMTSEIRVQQSRRQYRPMQIIKTPVFWVMYLMFVLMAAGGLMATAQLAPIAKDFKVADVPVSIFAAKFFCKIFLRLRLRAAPTHRELKTYSPVRSLPSSGLKSMLPRLAGKRLFLAPSFCVCVAISLLNFGRPS
jgi:hypothetical protein